MAAPLEVTVSRFVPSPPEEVRRLMFDPRRDPAWMAAVKSVEVLDETRVRRTGRFLGRTLRWTTETRSVTPERLELSIVEGPMRGTVFYRIESSAGGSNVSIRNIGEAPGFAPRWLLAWAMRRSLDADLRRLERALERTSPS